MKKRLLTINVYIYQAEPVENHFITETYYHFHRITL